MHKSILTAKRQVLHMEPVPTVYDPERQISTVHVDGRPQPAVDQLGYLLTMSKTMAEPGDDDPDRAGESLY